MNVCYSKSNPQQEDLYVEPFVNGTLMSTVLKNPSQEIHVSHATSASNSSKLKADIDTKENLNKNTI